MRSETLWVVVDGVFLVLQLGCLGYILMRPAQWAAQVERENQWWVKRGYVSPGFAGKCAAFEKSRGMIVLLIIGIVGVGFVLGIRLGIFLG